MKLVAREVMDWSSRRRDLALISRALLLQIRPLPKEEQKLLGRRYSLHIQDREIHAKGIVRSVVPLRRATLCWLDSTRFIDAFGMKVMMVTVIVGFIHGRTRRRTQMNGHVLVASTHSILL